MWLCFVSNPVSLTSLPLPAPRHQLLLLFIPSFPCGNTHRWARVRLLLPAHVQSCKYLPYAIARFAWTALAGQIPAVHAKDCELWAFHEVHVPPQWKGPRKARCQPTPAPAPIQAPQPQQASPFDTIILSSLFTHFASIHCWGLVLDIAAVASSSHITSLSHRLCQHSATLLSSLVYPLIHSDNLIHFTLSHNPPSGKTRLARTPPQHRIQALATFFSHTSLPASTCTDLPRASRLNPQPASVVFSCPTLIHLSSPIVPYGIQQRRRCHRSPALLSSSCSLSHRSHTRRRGRKNYKAPARDGVDFAALSRLSAFQPVGVACQNRQANLGLCSAFDALDRCCRP